MLSVMNKLGKNRSGFTLIELLVVVIIIAVLAAIGAPLLSANIDRARGAEAETALGGIRSAVRAFGVENNAYPATPTTAGTGLVVSDLAGHYYDSASFSIDPLTLDFGAGFFCIGADGSASLAPGKDKVTALDRSMNNEGTIYDDTVCAGTQLN